MSVFATILNELRPSPQLYVEGHVKTYLPESSTPWVQLAHLVVAPQFGLFDALQLQMLMDGLLSVEPTNRSDVFGPIGGRQARALVGELCFDEVVGTVTSQLRFTVTDPGIEVPFSYVDGSLTIDDKPGIVRYLKRRTFVRFYPNKAAARSAHSVLVWAG